MEAELILDAKAELGEGAVWDDARGVLYWVDIRPGILHVYDPARREDRAVPIGQPVGTVVPRRAGGVMLAVRHGFARCAPETGRIEIVAEPGAHLPGNRFNDGKCDPSGRFWAGTMDDHGAAGRGSLYRLDPDGRVVKKLDGVSCSNGIAWSADGRTMYYIDTPTRRVDAFDFAAAAGDIRNRRTAFRVPEDHGYPDGMTVDAEGMLWVAGWGGGRVVRWDPARGVPLAEIRLPVSQVSSCAFGGPGLDVLYVTSARTGLDAAARAREPLAGGLFAVRPGVRGVPASAFAG